MTKTLKHLARNCHGDGRPDCPIIESFAGGAAGLEQASSRDGRKFGVASL